MRMGTQEALRVTGVTKSELLKRQCVWIPWGSQWDADSDSGSLGWSLRVCISSPQVMLMLLWTTGLSNKALNHSDFGFQTDIDQSVYLADGERTNDFLKSEHQPARGPTQMCSSPDLLRYHPLCPGLCCCSFLLRPSHMLCSLINMHLKKGPSGSYLHLRTRVGGNPSAPKILIRTAGKDNCVMTGWREGASEEVALNAGTKGPWGTAVGVHRDWCKR